MNYVHPSLVSALIKNVPEVKQTAESTDTYNNQNHQLILLETMEKMEWEEASVVLVFCWQISFEEISVVSKYLSLFYMQVSLAL